MTIKVTAVLEITNFSVNFLRNFEVSLVEIQSVATAFWFIEAHAKFILHD